MNHSKHHSQSPIRAIWGSAVGMMAIVGVFMDNDSAVKAFAMMVPPIAAATTTVFVLKQEEQERKLPDEVQKGQQIEQRLQTLEAIVTKEEHWLPLSQIPQSRSNRSPENLSDSERGMLDQP